MNPDPGAGIPSAVVVDYGMGNLRSAQKGLEKAGVKAVVTSDPAKVRSAEAIVLPGVGAFKDCMANLTRAGLVSPVLEAIERGRPFLGICLGMQLLMTMSEEFGVHHGLDIISGRVVRFDPEAGLKIPHMGWNRVHYSSGNRLFEGIPDGSFFYFVHSYYVHPQNSSVVCGWTDYGERFCSAITRDNIFATQFHPEKSHHHGLKILENFGRIVASYK